MVAAAAMIATMMMISMLRPFERVTLRKAFFTMNIGVLVMDGQCVAPPVGRHGTVKHPAHCHDLHRAWTWCVEWMNGCCE